MWLRRILGFLFIIGLSLSLIAGLFLSWGYYYITRDLPKFTRIEDYQPPAVSKLYASDGTLIAEFFTEKRYPVKISEVPDILIKAFLAAEDSNFYTHQGVDPVSIFRAFYKNMQAGNAAQGGSTITQQVVKNLLLTPERKIERKIKEAFLAYELERRFSKDEILEIYLNQIFFGNGAYGIKAAVRLYFRKELPEVTLAEAALLAGLPQAPSKHSPLANPAKAHKRKVYVLGQMLKVHFITKEQYDQAMDEKIEVYAATQQNIFASPYYASEVRRIITEKFHELDLDADGLEITASVDLSAEEFGRNALHKGLREVDKRRGYRGPRTNLALGSQAYAAKYAARVPSELIPGEPYPALVLGKDKIGDLIRVLFGKKEISIDLKNSAWARTFLDANESKRGVKTSDLLKENDLIEVSLKKAEKEGAADFYQLDQTPNIEGGLVLLDPHTGEVKTMIGGYDYNQSQFNRVTQSLRQPGSTFKPVVYLTALDKFHYTPATIVQDQPRTFRIGDTFWTPANFDEEFLGPITLRTALEKSRNLVSADIVSRIGVDAPIETAKLLGITSPLGKNLSLSLGSSEVTLLELTRAYGVLAAKGVLFPSQFILKIKDRFGKVIFDAHADEAVKAQQVIKPSSAFVLTHMMEGVIQSGTGYKIKELGRPVAGKTGTSNDQMDAWFIGFTPEWACGVWVGFDQKKQIGPKETGGVVSAPIWLYFMRDFLKKREAEAQISVEKEAKAEAERLGIPYTPPEVQTQINFTPPEGVTPYWVYKSSGIEAKAGTPGAILEYFEDGTGPNKSVPESGGSAEDESSYLESPDL